MALSGAAAILWLVMLVQLRWTAGLCLAVGCRGSQTEVATDHGSSSSGGHHEGSTASEPTGASTADSSTTSAESISTSATDTSGASETATQSSESSSGVTSSDGSENDVSSTTGLATDGEATAASSSETTEGGTQGVETSGNATSSTTESTTSTGGAGSCGNGLPDEGELCDDGNLVGGDGCEDDCTSSDNVQPIWTFELGGADGYVDCGTGVAFDAEGNLILGAYTEPDVIWIRKLDVDYVEQWTVTYPGQPGGQCPRTKVAVDEDGNIGFTGGISTGGIDSNDGTFFGMLDADGGELWTGVVEDPEWSAAVSGDVAFDPDGNLLLVGAIVAPDGGNTFADLRIAKYDSLGALMWSDIYDPGFSAIGFGVDSDIEGNVIVGGVMRVDIAGDNDAVLRKYDSGGVEQWTNVVAGPDVGAYDYVYGVATNGTDIAVAGVYKPGGQSHQIWARRYDAGGGEQWTALHEEAGFGDGGRSVAWSSETGIVVAGTAVLAGNISSTWLGKLDDDGETVWTRQYNLLGAGDSWLAVAISPDGRIAVGGASQLAFPFDLEGHFAVFPP